MCSQHSDRRSRPYDGCLADTLSVRLIHFAGLCGQYRIVRQYRDHWTRHVLNRGVSRDSILNGTGSVGDGMFRHEAENHRARTGLYGWCARLGSRCRVRIPRVPKGVLYDLLVHAILTVLTALGLFLHPFYHSLVLLDVIRREETLLNVIRSVTKNGRSILWTALLALIMVYIYAILGFVFFRDDFLLEIQTFTPSANDTACTTVSSILQGSAQSSCVSDSMDSESKVERHCDSLIMCMLTTLHEGIRTDGGIADVLRRPSIHVSLDTGYRTIYARVSNT
ncbi:unnamed protein product [Echinostoma caproni]|uniref:Ion_trans domain-containing protein n=1 Tax=Echinostoma caproni TaxID=27848 RepID=A0A183ATZ4_9TREM|nr:unnamed protein product [Echinostoma caproni]